MQISVKLTSDLPYSVFDQSSATMRLVYNCLRIAIDWFCTVSAHFPVWYAACEVCWNTGCYEKDGRQDVMSLDCSTVRSKDFRCRKHKNESTGCSAHLYASDLLESCSVSVKTFFVWKNLKGQFIQKSKSEWYFDECFNCCLHYESHRGSK